MQHSSTEARVCALITGFYCLSYWDRILLKLICFFLFVDSFEFSGSLKILVIPLPPAPQLHSEVVPSILPAESFASVNQDSIS